MQRHLFLIGVRPEARDRYLELHAAVWPDVEERLRQSHIDNYSIFIHEDLLIGYFEYLGEDLAADMARVAADPVTQKWWELTEPCQVPLPRVARGWVEAAEVWHLGPSTSHPRGVERD
ncbi:L-rhamnose mutarotase [Microbacterium sp.]|uniref:L-rhamnose mutarotase n=1 Tax=Microbacterium sp. TaxID=51671 RepID=UPI003F70F44B